MNFVKRIARLWRGKDRGGCHDGLHASQADVTSEAPAAEPVQVVGNGNKKVPISIAAPWTGVGHPDNTLKTIAVLMEGERRDF